MSERQFLWDDLEAKDALKKHPKLYHYTNISGLEGIIKSQTLWATHYRGLNDSSEVQLMRPIIREMMNGICIEALRKLSNKNSIVRREIKKHGGLVAFAKREAKTIIDIYYDLSFGTAGRAGKSYADPFVVCFCSHSDEPEYVKENGLLSQWRGYGAEGGVAIIFDME